LKRRLAGCVTRCTSSCAAGRVDGDVNVKRRRKSEIFAARGDRAGKEGAQEKGAGSAAPSRGCESSANFAHADDGRSMKEADAEG
jgi:hypothetical protein